MAETPDKYVIPAGSRITVTWQGEKHDTVMREDAVVHLDFAGPEIPGADSEPVLPSRKPGTHWTRSIPESAYRAETVPEWEANELEIERAARMALDYEPGERTGT